MAIVLLAYWLDPKPPFCGETFDVIELYAGRARITRMAQAAGYSAIAADQKYDPNELSSLHMNENSGFVFLSYINIYPSCIHPTVKSPSIRGWRSS